MPAYQHIADDLRRRILDGEFAPGNALPSLAELAKQYKVSDRTAYEATRVLMREGLIHSRPGAPTLVRERPPSVRILRTPRRDAVGGSPWHGEIPTPDFENEYQVKSGPGEASPAIAARLGIEVGARTMCFQFVYSNNGSPTHLSTSWEPLALTLGNDAMMAKQGPDAGKSVYERMAKVGYPPDRVVEELMPHTLTGAEALALKLRAGIPVIVIERTHFHGELPVETADIVIPPPFRASYEILIG